MGVAWQPEGGLEGQGFLSGQSNSLKAGPWGILWEVGLQWCGFVRQGCLSDRELQSKDVRGSGLSAMQAGHNAVESTGRESGGVRTTQNSSRPKTGRGGGFQIAGVTKA